MAGGLGTRLRPLTHTGPKQLLPIANKPMSQYCMESIREAGITDIAIIIGGVGSNKVQEYYGDGHDFGVNITYIEQNEPKGIAEAFIIGENFIGNSPVALILGDNIFYGEGISSLLKSANKKKTSSIFAYQVSDPQRYGVVEFSKDGKVIGIQEKPKDPKSKFAITGIYFYDNTASSRAKEIKPSDRGELEISAINESYLKESKLHVEIMGRGMAWLDTGTFDSLNEASDYIKALEKRQGLKIGSPEEVAWRKGWINDEELEKLALIHHSSSYGNYLLNLLSFK